MIRAMLIVTAPIAATGVAQGQPFDSGYETRSIVVDAADLDLSHPAGLDTLEDRVKRAVDRICGSDRECRAEAWASTDRQVAWAVARDRWTRRLANEREAQIRACGWGPCQAPAPVYYAPPAPPPMPPAGVHVIIVYPPPPMIYYSR